MTRCSCTAHDGFLTERGYAEVAQRERLLYEDLAVEETLGYLDRVGSVSGLPLPKIHWDHELIDEQYRRFHNGS